MVSQASLIVTVEKCPSILYIVYFYTYYTIYIFNNQTKKQKQQHNATKLKRDHNNEKKQS